MTRTPRTALCLGALILGSACGSDSSTPEETGGAEAAEAHPEASDWRTEDLVDALGLTSDDDNYVFLSSDDITCAVDGVITSSTEATLYEQRAARVLTDPAGEVGVFWRPNPQTSPSQDTMTHPAVPGSCERDLEQRLVNLPAPAG